MPPVRSLASGELTVLFCHTSNKPSATTNAAEKISRACARHDIFNMFFFIFQCSNYQSDVQEVAQCARFCDGFVSFCIDSYSKWWARMDLTSLVFADDVICFHQCTCKMVASNRFEKLDIYSCRLHPTFHCESSMKRCRKVSSLLLV